MALPVVFPPVLYAPFAVLSAASVAAAWAPIVTAASRAPKLPREGEKQFQEAIVDLALRLGWKVYHTFDSRHSTSGFPDLFMVKGNRAIAAEVKTDVGIVSETQQPWLDAMAATGIEVYVWRPKDKQIIAGILIGRTQTGRLSAPCRSV